MSTFVVSWCHSGLESVVDLTEKFHQETMDILANKVTTNGANRIISMIMLRARYNLQRHYEVYLVEATEGITEEDIREMFANSPQTAAETIRERGNELYSDRIRPGEITIT